MDEKKIRELLHKANNPDVQAILGVIVAVIVAAVVASTLMNPQVYDATTDQLLTAKDITFIMYASYGGMGIGICYVLWKGGLIQALLHPVGVKAGIIHEHDWQKLENLGYKHCRICSRDLGEPWNYHPHFKYRCECGEETTDYKHGEVITLTQVMEEAGVQQIES